MIDVISYLEDRVVEYGRHLDVAKALNMRINESGVLGTIQIEIRHINTLKSGLIVHLYNIVEAVTARTLRVVGSTVVSELPKVWTDLILKEWVRSAVWSGEDKIGESAVMKLANASSALASGMPLAAFNIKGEPGSWNEKSIRKIAERLGCRLDLSESVSRAAYEPVYRNDTTALTYLANRRNEIAHGATTFEEGAHDLTLDEIEALAGRVFPFLREVSTSYQRYLTHKEFARSAGAVS